MQQERAKTQSGGLADVFVHAHLFSPPVKTCSPLDVRAQLERKFRLASEAPARKEQGSILDYGGSVGQSREAALTQLQRETAADGGDAVDNAASKYVALLLGIVTRHPSTDQPASVNPDHPEASHAGLALAADAQLRRAVTFEWQDVLVTSRQNSSAADAVFELASLLVAWALWQMRCASSLCQPSSAGARSDAATLVRHRR